MHESSPVSLPIVIVFKMYILALSAGVRFRCALSSARGTGLLPGFYFEKTAQKGGPTTDEYQEHHG